MKQQYLLKVVGNNSRQFISAIPLRILSEEVEDLPTNSTVKVTFFSHKCQKGVLQAVISNK